MAKAVRRDMRRAMGEHAVMQVEAQTDALGAHETRIHVLEHHVAQIDAAMRLANEHIDGLWRARHDTSTQHALINGALINRTRWSRLRWLWTGR